MDSLKSLAEVVWDALEHVRFVVWMLIRPDVTEKMALMQDGSFNFFFFKGALTYAVGVQENTKDWVQVERL